MKLEEMNEQQKAELYVLLQDQKLAEIESNKIFAKWIDRIPITLIILSLLYLLVKTV